MDDDYKADWNVWRKRLWQLPELLFNWRNWTFGIHWDAPDVDGFFTLAFGPIGLAWDMWP